MLPCLENSCGIVTLVDVTGSCGSLLVGRDAIQRLVAHQFKFTPCSLPAPLPGPRQLPDQHRGRSSLSLCPSSSLPSLLSVLAFPQEQEARYAVALGAQAALVADIEEAQRNVAQAQRVLSAVRKEVERWGRNADACELRHKQVSAEACGEVSMCRRRGREGSSGSNRQG
jgi:hypothetical protein